MSRPKAGEPYAFKTPEGVLYWHPPARRGAGGGEGPGYHMEPCTTHEGMVWLGTGSHRFLAPVGLLRAVVADLDGDAIATLTRERDEARAALALAYPRALQAAASEVQALLDDENETDGLDMEAILLTAKDCILALTPEDIDRITKEHEHG